LSRAFEQMASPVASHSCAEEHDWANTNRRGAKPQRNNFASPRLRG